MPIVCNLKWWREHLGFSQESFAHHLGLTRAGYRSLESGQSLPRLTTAYEIVKIIRRSDDRVAIEDVWVDTEAV